MGILSAELLHTMYRVFGLMSRGAPVSHSVPLRPSGGRRPHRSYGPWSRQLSSFFVFEPTPAAVGPRVANLSLPPRDLTLQKFKSLFSCPLEAVICTAVVQLFSPSLPQAPSIPPPLLLLPPTITTLGKCRPP